jgi:hypothetical protein
MSIFGSLSPDASGGVFQEPYSIKATNDVWQHMVMIFNDTTTRIGAYGSFNVPNNYVGNPAIVSVWTATATSGNTRQEFDYRAVGGNDAESLDQSGTQESVGVTDAAPGAAHRRLEASMSLTASNLAAGDTVEFEFFRDGADTGNDTMAAAMLLHDLLFEYTDA